MTMSRKDYRIIADAIREVSEHRTNTAEGRQTVAVVAVEVANALHANSALDLNGNRRFDRERFLIAAGAIR